MILVKEHMMLDMKLVNQNNMFLLQEFTFIQGNKIIKTHLNTHLIRHNIHRIRLLIIQIHLHNIHQIHLLIIQIHLHNIHQIHLLIILVRLLNSNLQYKFKLTRHHKIREVLTFQRLNHRKKNQKMKKMKEKILKVLELKQ